MFKNMNSDYIKIFIITSLVICILYIIEKLINTNNNIKLVKINNDTEKFNTDAVNDVDAVDNTEAGTASEGEGVDLNAIPYVVSESEYNNNDATIADLLNFHNNANQNYYNEDNSDLSRIVKDVNKVFKYLDADQRINLSKKKLDEKYLNDLRKQLNDITDNLSLYNNSINNINTGMVFDTENVGSSDNIIIKYNDDGTYAGNQNCFEYDSNTNTVSVKKCDTNNKKQVFTPVHIDTTQKFNENLHHNYTFVKSKDDKLPFAHSVIQVACDNCNENDKNYKKCLTIVKNNNNSGYTTFVEECNGRSAQRFYKYNNTVDN